MERCCRAKQGRRVKSHFELQLTLSGLLLHFCWADCECLCSGDRGYTSSDGEALSSEARKQKRRRFEQRRAQHYNMKNALQQGRQLAQQELGDEVEDDYDDKDENHEQRNVVSTNRVGSLRQQARQRLDQQNQRNGKACVG